MSVGPRLPRRSALALSVAGATAGAVALAGCDDGATPPPPATPNADPDVALVEHVLRRLAATQRVAERAGDPDLAALHRAHIEALDGTPPAAAGARTIAPGAMRTAEERLFEELGKAALAARSGALARLLASMSAAVAQRLSEGVR